MEKRVFIVLALLLLLTLPGFGPSAAADNNGSVPCQNCTNETVVAGLDPLLESYVSGDVANMTFSKHTYGNYTSYHHQRKIGDAVIGFDGITYVFNEKDELIENITRWRDGLPDELPQVISKEDAESIGGEAVELLYIDPELDDIFFSIRPTPMDPCWIVDVYSPADNLTYGNHTYVSDIVVVDAVTNEVLGHGIPPPSGYALTGPFHVEECTDPWIDRAENASYWLNTMGYDVSEVAVCPDSNTVKAAIQDKEVAMFYEVAHGTPTVFESGCGYENTTTSWDVKNWLEGYPQMPLTFFMSCDTGCENEMIDDATPSLSYAFRKGSNTSTATIGFCGLGANNDAWRQSLQWQDKFFQEANNGSTVKDAFDRANSACNYTALCSRLAGDPDLRLVPKLYRCPTFHSTIGDGYLENPGTSYSRVHNAQQGNFGTNSYVALVGQKYSGSTFTTDRAFLYFDTSSLEEELGDAPIVNAEIRLYGAYDYSSTDFYVTVQNGQPFYPYNPLRVGDYYYVHYSGTNGGTFHTSGWTTSGYNTITLNSDGRSWINRTGVTKLCIRSDRDIYSNEPSGREYVGFYTYENGEDYWPQLVITFQEEVSAPSVITQGASNFGISTAELYGYIADIGEQKADLIGFDWGESSSYGRSWQEGTDGDYIYGEGTFTHEITGLTPEVTYHLRAKAHNSAGWGYGSDVTFTFPAPVGAVVGEVRDVNGNLLPSTVVSLYEYGNGLYGSAVTSSDYAQYIIIVSQTGEYWLVGNKASFFVVDTSNMAALLPLHVDLTTPELLAAGYIFDFEGNYGLVPKCCTMSYAMESTNHWLFTPMDDVGNPHPEWQLSNWKAMESVHSWQFPIAN